MGARNAPVFGLYQPTKVVDFYGKWLAQMAAEAEAAAGGDGVGWVGE